MSIVEYLDGYLDEYQNEYQSLLDATPRQLRFQSEESLTSYLTSYLTKINESWTSLSDLERAEIYIALRYFKVYIRLDCGMCCECEECNSAYVNSIGWLSFEQVLLDCMSTQSIIDMAYEVNSSIALFVEVILKSSDMLKVENSRT